VAQTEAAFSTDDTKDPSTEATLVGRKFYSDVWMNGGREMANEIINKNKKNSMTPKKKLNCDTPVSPRVSLSANPRINISCEPN
jgi:hypothetical protein